ncbi:MAG: peptidoglycan-binding protein [Rhodobacteraceae bacterium]|nr:peptidoglycan-binding protein [Paracoccaceae bacterium]
MLEEARRREERLGLNRAAWQLIERRLAQRDLDPGKVDGVPTEQTRRAIRRYQKSAGLPVTGYMDRTTLSRLVLVIKF